MVEEKKQENNTEEPTTETEGNNKIFYTRMASFLLFAIIIPCAYLITRFHLFTQTSAMQIGIWGVICIGIIFGSISVLVKFYLDGMKYKYSYFKQIVSGLIKIILPLGILLLICTWLKDNMNELIEVIYVLIPCEIGAIFLNPLPKWCFDNNVEGIGEIYDKVILGKRENKNKEKKAQ